MGFCSELYQDYKEVVEIMRILGYKWPRLTTWKLTLFNIGWEDFRNRCRKFNP